MPHLTSFGKCIEKRGRAEYKEQRLKRNRKLLARLEEG